MLLICFVYVYMRGEVLLTLWFPISKIHFKNNSINPKNVTVEIKWLFNHMLTTCLQCWFANTWNFQIKFYGVWMIYYNLFYKEILLKTFKNHPMYVWGGAFLMQSRNQAKITCLHRGKRGGFTCCICFKNIYRYNWTFSTLLVILMMEFDCSKQSKLCLKFKNSV